MAEPELHPLVSLAADLIQKGTSEPWSYPAGAEEKLTAAIVAAAKSPDVADGVLGLFHAAIALSEEEKSPAAAGVILRALHAAKPKLELGASAKAALEQHLDAGLDKAVKRAPKVGEKAPEGSIKVSSFPPPRRFRG